MRDLHQIMKDIEPYIDFAFEHEEKFLKSFAKVGFDDVFCLSEISFGADEVKIVYVLESGQHLSDAITTEEFISWMRKVRGEYP